MLAVIAILSSLAAPGFQDLIRNNRAAAHTNSLMAAMAFARTEAVRRGEPVSLCPSTGEQTSCAKSTEWHGGWIAFADPAVTGQPEDGEILRAWGAFPQQATLTGPDLLRYRATGDLLAAQSFQYRIALGNGVVGRLACVNRVGRARIEKDADNCGTGF